MKWSSFFLALLIGCAKIPPSVPPPLPVPIPSPEASPVCEAARASEPICENSLFAEFDRDLKVAINSVSIAHPDWFFISPEQRWPLLTGWSSNGITQERLFHRFATAVTRTLCSLGYHASRDGDSIAIEKGDWREAYNVLDWKTGRVIAAGPNFFVSRCHGRTPDKTLETPPTIEPAQDFPSPEPTPSPEVP